MPAQPWRRQTQWRRGLRGAPPRRHVEHACSTEPEVERAHHVAPRVVPGEGPATSAPKGGEPLIDDGHDACRLVVGEEPVDASELVCRSALGADLDFGPYAA